jgi:ribose transport system permease protein
MRIVNDIFSERFALIGAWVLLIVLFGILRPTTFLTASNFETILGTQAVQAVVALSLLFPLVAGDFDLSVAGTSSLSAMVVAVLNVNYHVPVVPACACAIAVGILVGLVNGVLVAILDLNSLIITLGMSTVLSGIVFWISNDLTISGVSSGLTNIVVTDRLLGVPLEFYYALAICILLWYFFKFTPAGRRVLYVGSNREVARLSGIRVPRVRLGALVGSGVVSALAGVMSAGTLGGANPTSGNSLLLPAFAAAFLGATCISPGRFNPWGTIIAVYFLVTGITGLQLVGAASFVQDLFSGGALIIAVALSFVLRRRTQARRSA